VNQFVEECRREWKRLGVPDPVADEMAADLAADLEEAEAEGASAEEVLGSGASDPRSFAASWAAERAVIPPPRLTARPPRRSLMLPAIAALTVVTAIGAALVRFASPHVSASTTAIRVPPEFAGPRAPAPIAAIREPPPPKFAAPRAPLAVWTEPDGRGVVLTPANGSGVEINQVGSILLIVGIVGIIPSMLFLFWSSRAGPDHWSRRRTHIDNLPSGPAY
jgi:hypothetical protein